MTKHSTASLDWSSEIPLSTKFDDIYFSQENGLAETEFVFLKSNGLAEKFTSLRNSCFTIAETGFGTGLNFLAAIQLWMKTAPEDCLLHYISVEKYPISHDDLIKALAFWPELKELADQLIAQYPQSSPGYHQLSFDEGRVTLTLMLGDAVDCYSQLDAEVDAWFLDGFAPAKNPEMWSPELFQQIGRLSKSGTTFSTFTAAGIVKRGLRAVGFDIKKVPGFGRKREMLTGTYTATPEDFPELPRSPVWFRLPEKHTDKKTALVIGAGIAGCSTAYSLAQRGWKVTLIDRNSKIADEGSGNRQGALYAKLPVEPIPASRIHLSGFLFSSRFLKQHHTDNEDIWSPCGLLQIAGSDKEQSKHRKLVESGHYPESLVRFAEQAEASEIAGTEVTNSGLFFPDAGWVTPPLLCNWLVQHSNITVVTNTEVKTLSSPPEQWQAVSDDDRTFTASIAVVCSAADSIRLEQLSHLPVQKIRGQVSHSESLADGNNLKTVLCSEGYISPARQNHFCFGATFDLKDEGTDIRDSGHRHNLTKIEEMAPELAQGLISYHADKGLGGRVGFRCASPDKLPMIGPAPVYSHFCESYAGLRHDAKAVINTPASHYKGLFINLAHGSKGLITGPISGEIIASMLENEPLPLERELIEKLNPARFIIKNLKRRTI